MESGTDLPRVPPSEPPGTTAGRPRARGPVAAVVALAIVGALVAAGVYVVNREGTTGAPSGKGSAATSAGASSQGSGARAPANEVTVRVTAEDGRSWVSVKDSTGELLYDGLLRQGETRTFSAEESIDLVLGEPSVLSLVVNGRKTDDDFPSGKVKRLTYTKDD
ncbi:DUF4115 domain-containing protein [Streptomyces bottropensis]|uniref:DUF4115 domain-containing protein n=1 Tax=Streptomyces bottropensis TaxID=42235 RepID=UPI0037A31791